MVIDQTSMIRRVSDAISVVRRQLWLEGVFESHGQTEAFRNLPRPLQAVILAALASAA